MPATPDELMTFLAGLGIATSTVEHPPLFTVEESRARRGRIDGAHTKNLFLKDKKDRLFLVTAREDAAIALKHLHHVVGAASRLSFGRPELLLERLGVTPGAVTPFAAINDRPPTVTVVLDADLLRHERINCHPLTNTATTTIGRDDLIGFLRATGHEPLVAAVAGDDAA